MPGFRNFNKPFSTSLLVRPKVCFLPDRRMPAMSLTRVIFFKSCLLNFLSSIFAPIDLLLELPSLDCHCLIYVALQ